MHWFHAVLRLCHKESRGTNSIPQRGPLRQYPSISAIFKPTQYCSFYSGVWFSALPSYIQLLRSSEEGGSYPLGPAAHGQSSPTIGSSQKPFAKRQDHSQGDYFARLPKYDFLACENGNYFVWLPRSPSFPPHRIGGRNSELRARTLSHS